MPLACIRYQKQIDPNPYDVGFAEYAKLFLENPYQFQEWFQELQPIDLKRVLTDGDLDFSDLTNLFHEFCLDYGIMHKGGYLEVEETEEILNELSESIEWIKELTLAPTLSAALAKLEQQTF